MASTLGVYPDAYTLAEAIARLCEDAHPQQDGWRARCPNHQGKSDTSFSLTPTGDRVLLKCFADCPTSGIVHALGLTMADLFVKTPAQPNGHKQIVKTYDYYDASGTLVHQTVRYEPKAFRQRRPDPAEPGQWIWDLKTIRPVLYNLPAVLGAVQTGTTIYLCEGEKDADALIARELAATTCPMGAGKWRKHYTETLAHAHVVILPHNDMPGQQHALKVATALQGSAASITIVLGMHTAASGSDISDWIDAGGTREMFAARIAAAPLYTPQALPPTPALWGTPPAPAGSVTITAPWRDMLLTKKNGEPTQNAANMAMLLRHHPHWLQPENRLWWDSVRCKPMMGTTEIDDDVITAIAEWMGTTEKLPVSQLKLLERCVLKQCRADQQDLLQIWLNALPMWDTTPRLDTWLLTVADVPDTPYARAISKILLLSMVARAMNPGCLYRYVVILEGPEEAGKSTLVRAIAGPEWYVELSIGLDSKESHMMLQGAWVAEMAELDSLSRTEETRLKAFITLRQDSYIPKYSNFRMTTPRRAIFIGTTNEESYLKGQSGNTRFLPINIGNTIDVPAFEEIREQLFAEALVLWQLNPLTWWQLPDDVLEAAVEEREQRRLPNIYEESLGDWLDEGRFATTIYENGSVVKFISGETRWPEIARWFLKLQTPAEWKDMNLQKQVAQALKALGWKRQIIWRENKTMKVWEKPPF